MTKFKDAKDVGYVRVQGQLWLWYNAVEENKDAWDDKKEAARRQHRQFIQPATFSERQIGVPSNGTAAVSLAPRESQSQGISSMADITMSE